MTEYGTQAVISAAAMRRNRAVVVPAYAARLRQELERIGCEHIRVEAPEAVDLYEAYDENGHGIGEPIPAWEMAAFGDK